VQITQMQQAQPVKRRRQAGHDDVTPRELDACRGQGACEQPHPRVGQRPVGDQACDRFARAGAPVVWHGTIGPQVPEPSCVVRHLSRSIILMAPRPISGRRARMALAVETRL